MFLKKDFLTFKNTVWDTSIVKSKQGWVSVVFTQIIKNEEFLNKRIKEFNKTTQALKLIFKLMTN